jgi:hypothetical protein
VGAARTVVAARAKTEMVLRAYILARVYISLVSFEIAIKRVYFPRNACLGKE